MKIVFVLTGVVAVALYSHACSSSGPSEFSDQQCAECSDCKIPAVEGKGSLTCVAESPSITNINWAVMKPENIYVPTTSMTSPMRSEGPGMERLTVGLMYELIDISKNGFLRFTFANQTGTVSECNITVVYQNETPKNDEL